MGLVFGSILGPFFQAKKILLNCNPKLQQVPKGVSPFPPLQDDYLSQNKTLWIDMAVHLRFLHVIRQIPAYLLLFLYPVYSQCCPWSKPVSRVVNEFEYAPFIHLLIRIYIRIYSNVGSSMF